MTTNGTDPQQIPGFNVQGSAPNPYSTAGITASTAALTSAGNGSPGAPNPIAGDVTDILSNPGYADVSPSLVTRGTALAASLVPVPDAGTAFPNPVVLACTVVISGGAITSVKTAPYGGTLTDVGTADGTYTVPGAGQISLEYTTAPTWTWTTN